ncbi:TPA: hypothetical protein PEO98_002140 [Enterobacter hormaechei subsp. hoffmannii]|nr:hypothetical protein [Enterobacter hormaechei subsp. hoffmannii]
MNQDIEKIIYNAMRRNQIGAGVGSSATANEIIKGVKPYYHSASEAERQALIERLKKLKVEPGVPIPTNIEQLLSN